MHVLIVNQYGLPAGSSGITRHGDLGAHLVRRGHEVTVLASRFNYLTRSTPKGPGTERHDGVTFRWLETGAYRTNDRQRMRSMVSFTVRSILAGLRLPRRPDVVIASSPHLLAGVSGVVLARRYRVPLAFEVRDLWPSALVDLGAVRAGSRLEGVLAWLERRCYAWARRIIIVPPHADRRIAEVGGDPARCVAVPNATSFDLDSGSPAGEDATLPASLESTFAASGDRDVLLYAGAQGVSNGLNLVLDAMDELRATDPETYHRIALIFLGDGGRHDELVRDAAGRGHEHLRFHPPIEKPAVPAALNRASFLLVSFADAAVYDYGLSPNKLFDYLAAAKPVLLASRLTDTPVDEAQAGRRYDPASATDLAAGIRALVATPLNEREAMGHRGRDLVRRKYSIEATGDLLERTLSDLIATAR